MAKEQDNDKDLSVREAAYTFNCSEKLVRKLISNDLLKAYKVSRAIRIPASEIARMKGEI